MKNNPNNIIPVIDFDTFIGMDKTVNNLPRASEGFENDFNKAELTESLKSSAQAIHKAVLLEIRQGKTLNELKELAKSGQEINIVMQSSGNKEKDQMKETYVKAVAKELGIEDKNLKIHSGKTTVEALEQITVKDSRSIHYINNSTHNSKVQAVSKAGYAIYNSNSIKHEGRDKIANNKSLRSELKKIAKKVTTKVKTVQNNAEAIIKDLPKRVKEKVTGKSR